MAERVECVCGKMFATEDGRKQHVRRLRCRGPVVNTFCPECERTFGTFSGMRLHLSRAHPNKYNRGLELEVEGRPLSAGRWTEDELFRMAGEEVRYEDRHVKIYLNTIFPARSVKAIKSRRMQRDYKDLLGQLGEERGSVSAASNALGGSGWPCRRGMRPRVPDSGRWPPPADARLSLIFLVKTSAWRGTKSRRNFIKEMLKS